LAAHSSLRPLDLDRRDSRLFSCFDSKPHADELMLIVDGRFSMDLRLEISVLAQEISQGIFCQWNSRGIVGIFVLEIYHLE